MDIEEGEVEWKELLKNTDLWLNCGADSVLFLALVNNKLNNVGTWSSTQSRQARSANTAVGFCRYTIDLKRISGSCVATSSTQKIVFPQRNIFPLNCRSFIEAKCAARLVHTTSADSAMDGCVAKEWYKKSLLSIDAVHCGIPRLVRLVWMRLHWWLVNGAFGIRRWTTGLESFHAYATSNMFAILLTQQLTHLGRYSCCSSHSTKDIHGWSVPMYICISLSSVVRVINCGAKLSKNWSVRWRKIFA